ncbi:DUF3175 domain-containing protein [Flavitalea sp. BT771]|uniref:DUF3175 domain-containing protein n=1 Tax=Flavitalea sp. BT771 TaxID=3063329 RepID=UPI0026E21778|nr:DUF3175 domain-containing protein [Flavitalea sp. BT771]MDO6430538.1 DUF3175 domain-containing protein [Flavitalea sp. BT771]MDV6219322.1 DUF3175 domain-containing protein [Flavitalea sp. BT771]
MPTIKKNHARPKKAAAKKSAKKKSSGGRKWSAGVTQHSNALDLEKGVFTSGSPEKIANSLERSAKNSRRKKGSAYQSAMSMLNFYINRAGKNLPAKKKEVLTQAKDKLKAKHKKEDET